MSLGLCCQWIEPRIKRDKSIVYENVIDERTLQLGRFNSGKYTKDFITEVYNNNIEAHLQLVPKLASNNICSFRISSSLLPLFEFNRHLLENDTNMLQKLKALGALFAQHSIRVTTHPGQFVILNSDRDDVIDNSVRELEYHAWIFDAMGLERSTYNAINIHGGKRGSMEKLITSINTRLSDSVKSRLTLENDERCFSVKQLLKVHKETDVPIVFDSHHHVFNEDGLDMKKAFDKTLKTWSTKPLQHISNSEPGLKNPSFTQKRKHSFYIHTVPDCQLKAARKNSIDIEVEAKGKNIALLQMRADFDIPV